ncbi:MAG: helix-turn-helix domain-containing protein [Deltaproteobacteria bacterium]|jgi:AraC family transcriptional regulator of adaptative response / methylphosphotriester-DNA alkyltransferase methyltransferase|nr:helix-turn-helix domain-containing protein [Deltaproteobacteria bacterium]
MDLTLQEKWEAVIHCDERYDALFFYAVRSTGIFCRPSCKSRSPTQRNVLFFDTREEAVAAGFRPCKRCRPELLDFRPLEELAERTRNIIDACFSQRDQLAEAMKNLGVTRNYLIATFRRRFRVTPWQYKNALLAERARKMLSDSDEPIISIALGSGFESLSAFYAFFKKQTGTTPNQYRRAAKETDR